MAYKNSSKEKEYQKEYRETHKERIRYLKQQWEIKNWPKRLEQKRKWRKTPVAKIIQKRKDAKRYRNLGFVIKFPNIVNEEIDWHHINNEEVVAIPRDLHRLYSGKYHRDNLIYIIKQLY